MQRKSLHTGQHIFIFDYRNRFRRCNAQTLIFTVANFRVDYKIDVKITKLQRERRGTYFPPAGPLGTNSPTYYFDYENPYQQAVGEKQVQYIVKCLKLEKCR